MKNLWTVDCRLWTIACALLAASCTLLPNPETLEVKLKHGQTRTDIVNCLGQPDAVMDWNGQEQWLYGIHKADVTTFQDERGRYNRASEDVEKNACKMRVHWGEVFAEKYIIESTKRGVFGDHACYARLRKCTPRSGLRH